MLYGYALHMPDGDEWNQVGAPSCPISVPDSAGRIRDSGSRSVNSGGGWLSTGTIAGIAIGGAIVLILVGGAVLCACREKALNRSAAMGGMSNRVVNRV